MKGNVLFWHQSYLGHRLLGHTKLHVTGLSVTPDLGVGQRSEELLSQSRMLTFLGALLWGMETSVLRVSRKVLWGPRVSRGFIQLCFSCLPGEAVPEDLSAPPHLFHLSGLLTSLPVADWNPEEALEGRTRILSSRQPWVWKDLLLLKLSLFGRSLVVRHGMRKAQGCIHAYVTQEKQALL